MAASRNRPPESRLTGAAAAVLAAAGVAPGQTVCVALSGGVDSVVLLDVLQRLAPAAGFVLRAAHVHHGLSPAADDWLAFCEALCAERGLPFQAARVAVDRDHRGGIEAAAREARHAALAQVACDWLAFGHHADDQAETVLFRLLRGAGVHGAAAMRAADGRRLRPLLGMRRREILAHARAHGLRWVDDDSNADWRFARNRLRGEVLPLIESAFPGAVAALSRAAENFGEAAALLDELAASDQAACGGEVLAASALQALSESRLRNLLRWRIRAIGCEAPARARLVEAMRQLRDGGEHPLRLSLGAAALCRYRGRVWVEPGEGLQPAAPPAVAWGGEPELPWGRGSVRFEAVVGAGLRRAALEQAREVALCARWAGLQMRQGAARPRRSFKNLCQEAGVPAWLRGALPVLRVDGVAAWVAELGGAAEFACPAGEPGLLPVWRPGGGPVR